MKTNLTDYFSSTDAEYLFKLLILKSKNVFDAKTIKISEKAYKFEVSKMGDAGAIQS